MADVEIPARELSDLSGKVALVTGAGSGIGRAVALRLSEAGARICCIDIDERLAEATAMSLDADASRQPLALRVDVRDSGQVARGVTQCAERCGRVDILVNSAGVFPPIPLIEMTVDDWDRVLNINARGTFLASQAVAQHMSESGEGGAIVNIASKSAYQPTPGFGHYASSKGAVVMLTKALALELAPLNIRVNAVAPGSVSTEGAQGAGEAVRSRGDTPSKVSSFETRCPMGRPATADEIARVVMFLATPWSSYMTGETVLADGGYLLS